MISTVQYQRLKTSGVSLALDWFRMASMLIKLEYKKCKLFYF